MCVNHNGLSQRALVNISVFNKHADVHNGVPPSLLLSCVCERPVICVTLCHEVGRFLRHDDMMTDKRSFVLTQINIRIHIDFDPVPFGTLLVHHRTATLK